MKGHILIVISIINRIIIEMREVFMRKRKKLDEALVMTILLLSIISLIIGINVMKSRKGEMTVQKYYEALKEENYKNAFQYVFLYDKDSSDLVSLKYTEQQGKELYIERLNRLKKDKGYKVVEASARREVYRDDWWKEYYYNVELHIEIDGKINKYTETAKLNDNNELWVSSSQDKYSVLRDGRTGRYEELISD